MSNTGFYTAERSFWYSNPVTVFEMTMRVDASPARFCKGRLRGRHSVPRAFVGSRTVIQGAVLPTFSLDPPHDGRALASKRELGAEASPDIARSVAEPAT